MKKVKQIIVASDFGFCVGVKRAIEIARNARLENTGKVTVLKEIVHNQHVVDDLVEQGIGWVKDLDQIKEGVVIFSAHGVSPAIKEQARTKRLKIIDATCPLVSRVHELTKKQVADGYKIILIGDKGHDEVEGEVGEAPAAVFVVSKPEEIAQLPIMGGEKVAVVAQTTINGLETEPLVKEIKRFFSEAKIIPTVCDATKKRQQAVVNLAKKVSTILVVGSKKSANSKRLADIAQRLGAKAYLVESPEDINKKWVVNCKKVGVTAGASTPDWLMQEVIQKVRGI